MPLTATKYTKTSQNTATKYTKTSQNQKALVRGRELGWPRFLLNVLSRCYGRHL